MNEIHAASGQGPAKNRDNPSKSSGGKKTETTAKDGRTAGGKKTSTS